MIGCSTTRPPRMFYRNKSYMHVKKSQLVKRQSYRNLKHSQAMALFPTKDISQIRQIYFRNIKIIEVNIIFLTKGFLIQINRNQTQTCLAKWPHSLGLTTINIKISTIPHNKVSIKVNNSIHSSHNLFHAFIHIYHTFSFGIALNYLL